MENMENLAILDNASQICDLKQKKVVKRQLKSDFFIMMLIIYHMVQWIKVNRSSGSQSEDEY